MSKKWTGEELAKARKRCMAAFWWGHELPGEKKEIFSEVRGLIREGEHDAILHLLAVFDFNYQCLALTVFKDKDGFEYKSFALGKTKNPIRLKETTLDPLAEICWKEAETDITDEVVRRSCIFSPTNKQHNSLMHLVKLRQKELLLTDDDISIIELCEKERTQVSVFELDYQEQKIN